MGAERNASLKIHKITNAFYLIIIIPFLILGFLSSLVMYNCKMAGGYPNLFGHYVVQIEDNSFFEEQTGRFEMGSYQTFKSVNTNTLKPGDLIAYYSGHTEEIANGTAPDWVPIVPNSQEEQGGNSLSFQPIFKLGSGTENPSTDGKATVSIVKVGNYKGSITTEDGKQYDCISYFSSNSAEEENYDYNTLLLTVDIIGVAVPSNDMIVEFMVYSATFNGFLTFILIPCLFLVAMKIISLWFYKKYMVNVNFEKNAQIITESEDISYSRILNATKTGRFEKGPPKTRTPFWKTISAKISDEDAEKELFGKKEKGRIKSIERLGKKSRKGKEEISEKDLAGKRYIGEAPKPTIQKPQKEEKKAPVALDIKPIMEEDYGKKSAKELRLEEKRLRKLKEDELREEFERQKRQNLQEEGLLDKELENAEHALTKDLKKQQKLLKKQAKFAKPKKQQEYDRNIKIKENPLFKKAKQFNFDEEIANVNKAKIKANAEVDFFENELKKSKEKLIDQMAKKPKGKLADSIVEMPAAKPKWVDAPKMPTLETDKPEPVFKMPTKHEIELEENLEKRKNKRIARETALLDKQLAKSKRKMLKSIKAGTAQDVIDAHTPIKETVSIMPKLARERPTQEVEEKIGVSLMTEAKLHNRFEEEKLRKAQKQAEVEKTFFDKLMEESQDKYLESIKKQQEERAKKAKQDTKVKKPPKRVERPQDFPKDLPQMPEQNSDSLFIPGPALKSIKGIKAETKKQGPSTEDAIFTANKYDFLMDDGKKKSKREQKKAEKQRAQKAKKQAQAEAARNYFQQQLNKKK